MCSNKFTLLLHAFAFAIALALAFHCANWAESQPNRLRPVLSLRYPSVISVVLAAVGSLLPSHGPPGTRRSCTRPLLTWAHTFQGNGCFPSQRDSSKQCSCLSLLRVCIGACKVLSCLSCGVCLPCPLLKIPCVARGYVHFSSVVDRIAVGLLAQQAWTGLRIHLGAPPDSRGV
jgi:hypothetical protein